MSGISSVVGVLPPAFRSVTMAPPVRLTLSGVDGGGALVVDPDMVACASLKIHDESPRPSLIQVENGTESLRFALKEPEKVGELEKVLRTIAGRATPARCALTRNPVVVLPRDPATAVVDAAWRAALNCAGLGFDAVEFYIADEDGKRGNFLKRVPVPLSQPILVSAALVSHADPEVLIGHLATYMTATSAIYREPVTYTLIIDDQLPDLTARSAFLKQLREAEAFGAYDAGWLTLVGAAGLVGGIVCAVIGAEVDSVGLVWGGLSAVVAGVVGLGVSSFVDAGAIPKSLTLDVWDEGARLGHMERRRVSFWSGTRSTWGD